LLGEVYEDISEENLEIFFRIAIVGHKQGLPFNYFEELGEGELLFSELFNDNPILQEQVSNVHLSLLKMLKATLELVKDDDPKPCPPKTIPHIAEFDILSM